MSPVFTVLDVPFNDFSSAVFGEVFFVSDKLLSVPVNLSSPEIDGVGVVGVVGVVVGVSSDLFSFLYASSAVVNTSTLLTSAF